MELNDFVSNENVIERLGTLLCSGRFPHALIIEGEEGLGKKTLARLLACALVCRDENPPCMECSQCKKVVGGLHPDVKEYIPSGAANSFHVDTVREIIKDVYMKPNEADYKIYILANAHCMNASAQNALLKVLEEPPEYAVFILTARSKSAMLPTVLSRSVCVTLEGVDISLGAQYISNHSEAADYNSAEKMLKAENGNIGKAIAALNDSKSAELIETCNQMCRALGDGSEFYLLSLCAAFQNDRQAVVFACDMLKNIFRDALAADSEGSCISGQWETASYLKTRLNRAALLRLVSVCDEIKRLALMNANNAILITKFCYSLFRAVGR